MRSHALCDPGGGPTRGASGSQSTNSATQSLVWPLCALITSRTNQPGGRRSTYSVAMFTTRHALLLNHGVLFHLLGGAATYVVLGADLSAMWETFHGDNRKRTATNAIAPIPASTVVPSPRSGLELRSSCIISPNAPNSNKQHQGTFLRSERDCKRREAARIEGFAGRRADPNGLGKSL